MNLSLSSDIHLTGNLVEEAPNLRKGYLAFHSAAS